MAARWSASRSPSRWTVTLALTGSLGCSATPAVVAPSAGPLPARLVVEATQGAAVHVDGIEVGKAPLPKPVEAEPGVHHLAVTLDGHHAHEQQVVLERGHPRQILVDLRETAQRKWAWASMGVGGAGVATGIVFGVLSVVEHRSAQDLEVADDATDEERRAYDEAIAARDTYRVVSGVSAGAGIAIFLTGAVLFAFDAPDVPRPREGRPVGDVSFAPWLGPGVLGGAAHIELLMSAPRPSQWLLAGLSAVALAAVAKEARAEEPDLIPSEEYLPEESDEADGYAPSDALRPIEVEVRGLKHPPSVSSLTRAEVRQLPGAFGDPFRAIEILPGVTPIVSGLPFFYVRGAPPGNVGYFLDGVRVPYLFHAAAGPSVVHPAIVERVDLYAGGYPARFGRYAGAVVVAEATEPRSDWHGEAVLRIVDAGALVEGGTEDGRFTALAGGRYSYTAGLFSLISPEITLDYRDYQARVAYDVTPRDRVSLFAFGAYDFLSQTTNEIETVLFGSEFYRVDGRYDARLPGGGKLRAAVTFGYDQTRVADGRNTRDVSVASRVELSQPLGDDLTLRAGLDVQQDLYSAAPRPYVDPDDPGNEAYDSLFPPRNDAAAGFWADVEWRMHPRVLVTPGVRADMFFSNGASAMSADPRLAVVVQAHERVRLLHALGMAHQTPSFIVPVPGLAVASLQGGLQRSLQASAGVEVDLPLSITATATAFDAVFLNMTDSIGVRPPGDDATQIPRSTGGSKGFELYLRRSLASRLGGFIAYTFSRTTRAIDGYKFPAAFDRSHVFHSAVSVDMTRGWRGGLRFSVYSGAPQLSAPAGLPDLYRPSAPERDPPFYRLDFRVEKKWRFGPTGWVSVVLEMVNATLNLETLNGNEVGPVTIPSFGVEGGF